MYAVGDKRAETQWRTGGWGVEGEGKIRVAECMREKVIKELVERSSSSTGNWPTMGFPFTLVEEEKERRRKREKNSRRYHRVFCLKKTS